MTFINHSLTERYILKSMFRNLSKYKIALIVSSFFFVTCKSVNQKDSPDLFLKAHEEYNAGNYEKVVKLCNRLIDVDDTNGEYFFMRATAFGSLNKNKSAINDFLKCVNLKYRVSASYYDLGLLHAYINDTLAVSYLKKAYDNYSEDEKELSRETILQEYQACQKRISKN